MRVVGICALALLFCEALACQTTQGLITGRVLDRSTDTPLANARVEYEQIETHTEGISRSGADGSYYLSLLPPGVYRIRASLSDYQAREAYEVSLSVAGYVHIDFYLRPLRDVWERGSRGTLVLQNNTILPFYGPDVDPSYIGTFEPESQVKGQLEPSISAVIDPRAIAALPLVGRDVYTALVLQPGVTTDSATTRSLGLSANGQRPSSSNFLLDGIEQNDGLLGGPGIQLAPEMVQEYRVSTNNFSAEYGRTAGYIANAVTRAASSAWHGVFYGDLNNTLLNANTFQHNTAGVARTAQHEIEAGVSLGGRIPKSRILTWTAVDKFGSRSFADPEIHQLPSQAFADGLQTNSRAWQLLHTYPPRAWADSAGDYGCVTLRRPVTLRRFTGLERIDYSSPERNHFTARIAGDSLDRPDYDWTAYGESPLRLNALGFAGGLTHLWSASLVSELRLGMQESSRSWTPALSNLPLLIGSLEAELPTQSCCGVKGWRDKTHTAEVSTASVLSEGTHVLKAGLGLLDARPRIGFTIPSSGEFVFDCLKPAPTCGDSYIFALDNPGGFTTMLSRLAIAQNVYRAPDTNRLYRYDQPYAFLQADFRATPRLTVNAGLRYDRPPAPVNIGTDPDVVIQLGSGSTLDDRVNSAHPVTQRGALYQARPNDFSLRLGFSFGLFKMPGTVLRGGFGTFYDRPLENSWTTASANDLTLVTFATPPCPMQVFYKLGSEAGTPPGCSSSGSNATVFNPTLFEPDLRSARVESAFLSLQQPLGRNAALELNATTSHGRHLLATDVLNRDIFPVNNLPQITYRTDQGVSDYNGLSAVVRYRTRRATFNTSWTWSHAIDNQSDPLLGEFFDLGFSNQTDRIDRQYNNGFTFEGNSRADRANSDFDQRQNLVGWAYIAIPSARAGLFEPVLRGWSSAIVFSARSGLPYTVHAGDVSCVPICNTRAELLNSAAVRVSVPVPGGVQLLNPNAFAAPAPKQNGNTGRNEFRGPGFANLDLSLARTFAVARFAERVRLTVRADAFNLFNHANLQNPVTYLGLDTFGESSYGGASPRSGFPSLTPLLANSREIHMLLRLEF